MRSPHNGDRGGEAAPPPDRGVELQRERAVRALADACADGRLTLDDMADRVEAASHATTYQELEKITGDLPGPRGGAVGAPRRGARRLLVGFLGQCGRWPFPALRPKVVAVAVLGEVVIDLRRTPLTSFRTEITAVAVAGEVLIIVPAGLRVEVDRDDAVIGYVAGPRPDPGPAPGPGPGSGGDGGRAGGPLTPVLHVTAFAALGDIRVRHEGRPSA